MPIPSRDSATGSTNCATREGNAGKALTMMVEALELLDLEGGADTAGAHLDLAIHRLREWIDRDRS